MESESIHPGKSDFFQKISSKSCRRGLLASYHECEREKISLSTVPVGLTDQSAGKSKSTNQASHTHTYLISRVLLLKPPPDGRIFTLRFLDDDLNTVAVEAVAFHWLDSRGSYRKISSWNLSLQCAGCDARQAPLCSLGLTSASQRTIETGVCRLSPYLCRYRPRSITNPLRNSSTKYV